MHGVQRRVWHWCCTRTDVCGVFLRERYPARPSSTESGASVHPGFGCTVRVLPRRPRARCTACNGECGISSALAQMWVGGYCGSAAPQDHRLLKAVRPSILAFAVPYGCCRAGPRWMHGVQWRVWHWCCTGVDVCGVFLRKRYPARPSSTESGASVHPGAKAAGCDWLTVWLPRVGVTTGRLAACCL
jgi:hypothetical protein